MVWGSSSWFTQVTVVPRGTVTAAGAKANSRMSTLETGAAGAVPAARAASNTAPVIVHVLFTSLLLVRLAAIGRSPLLTVEPRRRSVLRELFSMGTIVPVGRYGGRGRQSAATIGGMIGREARDAGGGLGREALAYVDTLHNLARYLTGNAADAEDLVQETYARALKAADRFTPGTNLKAWLFRILRNTFVSAYRRRRNDPTVGGLDTVEPVIPAVSEEAWLRDDVELDRLRKIVAEEIEAALMS